MAAQGVGKIAAVAPWTASARPLATLVAGTSLALCACATRENAEQQRTVLDGYRRIAAAAYEDSLTSAEALLDTTRRFVTQPSAQGLADARAAWVAARRPYAQTEALRFGNWVVDEWEAQVNAWPLDEGLIDYVDADYVPTADNALARADLIHARTLDFGGTRIDMPAINPALLVHLQRLAPVETSVAVGYHAIEFLLWGQDRDTDGPGARPWTDYAQVDDQCTDGARRTASAEICRRRADYLLAVIQLLINDLTEMQRHWTADVGSYGMRLVRGDAHDGLRRVLFGMSSLAAAELAGERIEVALQTRAQEEEQDCFSDQTHDSLRHNLLGIANVWGGSYRRGDGSLLTVPGLRALVAARDATQARRIDRLLADATQAAAQDGAPFDQLILDRPAGGRAQLQRLAAALRALARELERAGAILGLGPLNPASASQAQTAPGGATTALKRSPDETLERDAFSQPAANLDSDGRARFMVGNSFFTAPWVIAPASTEARDGLGPLYNASACQHCHIRDGRGHPPDSRRADASGSLLRIAVSDGRASDPVYGHQIQDRAVPGLAAEARIAVRWDSTQIEMNDGSIIELRRPVTTLSDLRYGAPAQPLHSSLRIAPPMIGLGLLEAIDAADIRGGADPGDRDGDGISGRAADLAAADSAAPALGRFGWKAAQPTVREQVVSALRHDMGLTTTPGEPSACTPAQADCLRAASGGDPEVSADILDALSFYAAHLAVPARRWTDAREVRDGERLFGEIGCAGCHRPSWRTSTQAASTALADQAIQPYTDLLLHDMGAGLADGVREGSAEGREWRTPPLWGLHLTKAVSGAEAGFLHDGRARTLEEAILWHGGEAQPAQAAFRALPKAQRDALIWFLKSL